MFFTLVTRNLSIVLCWEQYLFKFQIVLHTYTRQHLMHLQFRKNSKMT